MKLFKVALSLALSLPAVTSFASSDTAAQQSVSDDLQQLLSQQAITANQDFNRGVQKLLNVVNNNDRIDHFSDEVRSVRNHGRYLLTALRQTADGFSGEDVGDSFYELRSEWSYTREQLRPFASRYADVRLHLAKTQLLFEELNRKVNVMLNN